MTNPLPVDRVVSPVDAIYHADDNQPLSAGDYFRSIHKDSVYMLLGKIPSVHEGDDILQYGANIYGKPVHSIANGIVIDAELVLRSTWGKYVVIQHFREDGTSFSSKYAHLKDMNVKKGDLVLSGQQIGTVGDSEGRFVPHLHFAICVTDLLETDPRNWPSTGHDEEQATAIIDANYVDPLQFIKDNQTAYSAADILAMWVTASDGLIVRDSPSHDAKRIASFSYKAIVNVYSKPVLNGYVKRSDGPGFMAVQWLSTDTVATPAASVYAGVMGLWIHNLGGTIPTDIDKLAQYVKDNYPGINAVYVKTHDGTDWMRKFNAFGISGTAELSHYVQSFNALGIGVHAWCVPHGISVDAETELLRQVSQVKGIASIILDIEPYSGFWQVGKAGVAPFVFAMRAKVPNFPISIAVDPRKFHYDEINPTEWFKGVNAVHMETYWQTFQQPADMVMKEAFDAWGKSPIPAIPIFPLEQVNVDDVKRERTNSIATYGSIGFSYWLLGPTAELDALSDGITPPPPPPVIIPPSPAKTKYATKIGLHIMPGANDEKILSVLSSAHSMGRPIPGVTLVKMGGGFSNGMQVRDIKQVSPETKVILRWYPRNENVDGDGVVDVKSYFAGLSADDKLADWHQITNEPTFDSQLIRWFTEAVQGADEVGIKLAVACFSNGYPDLGIINQIAPLINSMQKDGHLYMRHGYVLPDPGGAWDSDWTQLRYRRDMVGLGLHVPVVLGEFGTAFATKYSTDDFVNHIKAVDAEMMADDNLLWASLWTFGGGGAWHDSLIGDDKLDRLSEYLIHG